MLLNRTGVIYKRETVCQSLARLSNHLVNMSTTGLVASFFALNIGPTAASAVGRSVGVAGALLISSGNLQCPIIAFLALHLCGGSKSPPPINFTNDRDR